MYARLGQSRWVRRWVSGVLSGLVIEAILLLLAPLWHWATYIRDGGWALDGMMRAVAEVSSLPVGRSSHVPRLVYIDVDERTWRSTQWGGGEPIRAPRPEMLRLIKQAFAQGARYVVLDILIEGPRLDAENEAFASDLLYEVIPMLRAPDADSTMPPRRLILVRSVRPRLSAEGPVNDGLPEVQPSALDRAVAGSSGLIASASPYFVQSSDGVLREWWLWRVACQLSTDGQAPQLKILPSVQLLIATWTGGGSDDRSAPWRSPPSVACPDSSDERAVETSKDSMSVATLRWVEQHVKIANLDRDEITASDLARVDEEQDDPPLANHIVYRLFDILGHRGRVRPASGANFSRIPASSVLALQPGSTAPWSRLLTNSIVVIGQSNSGSADTYVTPLGPMSGSLVILNGVDSILRYGFLRTAPELSLRIPISIAVVLVSSALLAFWHGIIAELVAGALVMVCALALSIYLLIRLGVWFDFMAPLAGTLVGIVWDIFHEEHEPKAVDGISSTTLEGKPHS